MSLENKGIKVGVPAPDWRLESITGLPFQAAQYRGRPLLMFFFRGTWCPSCRKQMEDAATAWNEIEPLARLVGIVGQSTEEVKTFLERHPLPYPLLPDTTRQVIKAYGVYQPFSLDGFRIAHPTSVIVDGAGIVQYCYVGDSQFDRPDLSQLIAQLRTLAASRLA